MGLVISLPLFGSEESSAVSCAVALTVAAKPIHIAHSVDAATRIEVLNLTDREQCITKPRGFSYRVVRRSGSEVALNANSEGDGVLVLELVDRRRLGSRRTQGSRARHL